VAALSEVRRFDPDRFNAEVETLSSIVRGAALGTFDAFAGEAAAGLRALLVAQSVTIFTCTKADAQVRSVAEAGEVPLPRPRNLDGSVRRAVLRREAFATRTKDGHSLWAAVPAPDRSIVLHVARKERAFAARELQATEIILAILASLAANERVADEARAFATNVLELFRVNPWPVLIYDAQTGRCIEANAAAIALYGFTRDEFLGRTLGTPPKPQHTFQPQRPVMVAQRRKDGSDLFVEQTVSSLVVEGRPLHVVILSDVTERIRAEVSQREAEAALQRISRLAWVGHWWTDLETGVCFWSEELFAIARVAKPGPFPSSPGSGYETLKRHVHPGDLAWVIAELKAVADTGKTRRVDYRSIRGDGTQHWVEMIAAREDDADGRPSRLVGTIIDITERKETEARLEFLAKYDGLTGLANRSRLVDRLVAFFEEADRRQRRVAVLFLDLDNFKRVNDTLGHAAGDRFLQSIATRLRRIVDSENVVARIGGDEFVVAVGGLESDRDAAAVAERIVTELKLPVALPEGTFFVEASIGIACYPRDARDADGLITNADTAMYRAKRDHPGSFRFYSADMRKAAIARYKIESELRQAIAGDELAVEYQPIVSIEGDVVGSEALVRWNHQSGRRSPGEFIPVAEDSGLIIPLGRLVLREACRQMSFWQNPHFPLGISVNVSASQLIAPDFVETVRTALVDSRLSPALLELEITETAMNRDFDRAAKAIRELRAMGVKIGIDDFGTGYNALTSLRDYTFDTVKLDRSFVADVATSPSARAIAEAVIGAARAFGARVIAEGVETETQRRALRDLGCDHAQGWLFSPALPVQLFNALAGAGIRLPVLPRDLEAVKKSR
jgi:diguanylate cyclase (GGDEF)-like protein/PAS domain S-box-containing protein